MEQEKQQHSLHINERLEKQKINEIFSERKDIAAGDEEAQTQLLNRIIGELVINTRFIAPATVTDKSGDEKEVTFHLIKSKEGGKYFPLFTSSEDLELWKEMGDKDTVQLSFDDYAQLLGANNECMGMVVNPLSDNFKAEKGIVAQWFEKKQILQRGHANHTITDDSSFEFYAPEPYPFELADKLTETAKGMEEINRLWLRGVKLDGVDGYLAVVEFTGGDRNKVFMPLGESAKPYLNDKPIHFVELSPGFAELAVQDNHPIYAKV